MLKKKFNISFCAYFKVYVSLRVMLHGYVGNSDPAWNGRYYAGLAFLLGFALQVCLLSFAHDERTSGVAICFVAFFSYLVHAHASVSVVLNVCFLFAWGFRVAIRGVPEPRHKMFLDPPACDAAFGKSIWTWLLVTPTTYAVVLDEREISRSFPFVGATLCSIGFVIDLLERDSREGRYTRNPYAFCSACVSWGLFLIHPSLWTLPFPPLFSALLIFGAGGYLAEESVRTGRALKDPAYAEYIRTVSPFFPLPRRVYANLPVACKRTCCGDRVPM